jgi:hypothetical protein
MDVAQGPKDLSGTNDKKLRWLRPRFPRRGARVLQTACKPNSVEDGHSSRRRITAALQQPTRRFQRPPFQVATRLGAPGRHALAAVGQAANSLPIWSCSVWGLPCPRLYSRSGALLPHLFTLTRRSRGWRYIFCGTGRLPALKPESRTLSGTLPCGVRTFLSRSAFTLWQRPPSSPAISILAAAEVVRVRHFAFTGQAAKNSL